jgi:hypothetical protein
VFSTFIVDNNNAKCNANYATCNYSRPNGVFDNMLSENTVSIVLSLSRDLNFVQKIPAAENARSASTEVGGIVSSQLYTVCRHILISDHFSP